MFLSFSISLILFCTATPVANAAVIATHENFLSPAECDNLLRAHQDVPVKGAKGRVAVEVDSNIYQRIIEELVDASGSDETTCAANTSDKDGEFNTVFLSKIVSTTAHHQDHHVEYEEKHGQVLQDEKAAFVFLEDNQDAYFSHGKDKIPATKGKLVVFDGGEAHQTVLKSASAVHLLGPFSSVNRRLSLVGDAPTPAVVVTIYHDDNGNGEVDDEGDSRVPNVLCSFFTHHHHLVKAERTNENGECSYDEGNPDLLPITVKFSHLPHNKKVIIPQKGKLVVENVHLLGVNLDVLIDDKCSDLLDCVFYYVFFGWLLEFLHGLW